MIEKYIDATELKRLLSGLIAVLGALVIAGLFASLVVPGLRNANRPPTPMPVNPVANEPGWLDPAEFPPEEGKDVPAVDAVALIASSPDLVARGKSLYATSCAFCHGASGRGDGPAAATMNPRPRDLTSPDGWRNGYDLPGIFQTLGAGVPGTSMPAYDDLSTSNRMAVAHYVQALGAFAHGPGSPDALARLSTELAAPGETTPNRIPVSMAMARLQSEFVALRPIAVGPEAGGPGAELLRRVIVDPARSAQTLGAAASWRAGPQALAASILPGVPENGFAVRVATLSAAEWQALHAELLQILPAPQDGSRNGGAP